MKKTLKTKLGKIFTSFASFLLLVNSFAPYSVAVAQELNPTETPVEVQATPTETPAEPTAPPAEPTAVPAVEPTAVPTVEPTVAPTAEPTVTDVQPTAAPASEPTVPAPPEATNTPAPEVLSSEAPTPTVSVENDLSPPAEVSAKIVENKSASSVLDLLGEMQITSEGSATLVTDKADYAPTDSVLITGTGFTPDTAYTIYITTPSGDFSFSDSVTSDSSGNLLYTYQLDGTYRPNYKIEIKLADSVVASTTFTDDSGASANLDQYDNAGVGIGWQNGNLNQNDAEYREGDSVPYRFVMSGVGAGSHAITIEWDTTKSDKHALDYITTYNRTESADPCTGVPGCGSPSTYPIPPQPGTVNQVPGNFTLFNGTITGVSAYTISGTDNAARITITFTATSLTPVLAVGGHIATQIDWGLGQAAGAVPGSPYHMRLIDIDGGGGNQDRSLAAGAVFPVPGLTTQVSLSEVVINNSVTDTATYTTVGSNGNVTGTTSFFVCGPNISATACTTSGTQVGTAVTNSLNQAVSSAFTPSLLGFYCFRAEYTPDDVAQYSPFNHTNNNTECFNVINPPTGTLRVVKIVINNNGGTLTENNFSFSVDGGTAIPFEVDGQNDLVKNPGTYDVTEPAVSGYTTTYDNCTDVVVPSNGLATCTITNDDQPGTLIVRKIVSNLNGGTLEADNFTFSVDGGTPVAFETDGQNDLTVNAGTYDVTEPAVSGYTTTYDNCTDMVVPNGGSATCTITNTDVAPTLTLVKEVTNDNGGNNPASGWTLSAAGTGGFSGTGAQDSVLNKAVLGPIAVKANVGYLLSESGPTGYTSGTWSCTSGLSAAAPIVTLLPGENVTCTITNDDIAPKLTLIKDPTNDSGGQAQPDDFDLRIGGNLVSSGVAQTLSANTPYAISETQLPGYTWVSITGNPKCPTVLDGAITLDEGDDITCTITNDDQHGTLIIRKTVINDNGGTLEADDFSYQLGAAPAVPFTPVAGSPLSGENQIIVDAGSYTVTEPPVDGYFTTYHNCTNVSVTNGGTSICTITNNDIQPKLIVIKHVVTNNAGSAPASAFTMSVTGTEVDPASFPGEEAPGTEVNLNAGSYSVGETGPSGYASQFSDDCDGSIAIGETKTCTVTNDDQPGTLIVKKIVANTNGGSAIPSNFTMYVSATNPSDDEFPGSSAGTSITVDAGPYTVTESSVPGYSASYDNCDGTIANGETRTCTITNTSQFGHIVVDKVTNPSGDLQSFPFYLDKGDASVTDDIAGFPLTDTDPAYDSGLLLPGTGYRVYEVLPNGWDQTGINCVSSIGDTETAGSIEIDPGETVTCTFTNTKYGMIKLIKAVNPGYNGDPFSFSGDLSSTLHPTNNSNNNLASQLLPGTYHTTEADPTPGYDLTSIVCDDNDSTGDLNSRTATYNLQAGETVTCTFTNTRRGSVQGRKYNDVNGNGTFDLSEKNEAGDPNRLDGWTINIFDAGQNLVGSMVTGDDTTVAGLVDKGQYRFINLVPGTYTVCEVSQAGWIQTQPAGQGCHTVDVAAGQARDTIQFGNFQLGQVTACKVQDMDGKIDTDTDRSVLPGWTVNLLNNRQIVDTQITGLDGCYTWTNLGPGNYSVSEEVPVTWNNLTPDTHVFGNAVSGQDVSFTFINALKYGRIIVHKEIRSEVNFEVAPLFTFNLTGLATGSATIASGGSHTFDNLIPGDYSLGEADLQGWKLSDISCHSGETNGVLSLFRVAPLFTNPTALTLDPDETIHCTFYNEFVTPEALLAKTNDASGDKSPGEAVTFTLTLNISQNDMNDVLVYDSPAAGFKYRSGSWLVTKNGAPFSITEPDYSSGVGIWNLGDLVVGDEVIMTYIADIDGNQTPGLYSDLAWARGADVGGTPVLANISTTPQYFVGTRVNVVKSTQDSAQVNVIREEKVLGASVELPSTGSPNAWLILGSLLSLFGIGLVISSKRRTMNVFFAIAVALGMLVAGPTAVRAAVDPGFSLKVAEPKTPTNQDNFRLTFVALDINGNAVSVSCQKKSPSDGSPVQFATVSLPAGGGSGFCQVDSSVLNTAGTFLFRVVADNGPADDLTQDVSVNFSAEHPYNPNDYKKEQLNSCDYRISFHTADDGGRTDYVELYRSDKTSFTADSGTRVASQGIGSNQNGQFVNSVPDCNKTWYFAIRSFNASGNGSDIVGDSKTETIIVNPTTTTTRGAIPVSGSGITGEGEATGEPEVMGESTDLLDETSSPSGIFANWSWWKTAGLGLLLGGFLYLFFLRRKEQNT